MFKVYIYNYKNSSGNIVAGPDLMFEIPTDFEHGIPVSQFKLTASEGNAVSLDFNMDAKSPYFDSLIQMKTRLLVEYGTDAVFYGRVLKENSSSIVQSKQVHCEGGLGFLNDTYYEGVKEDALKEIGIETYLDRVIDNHNTMIGDDAAYAWKKIYKGTISFTLPNEQKKLEPTSWTQSLSLLQNLAKKYGGHFTTRLTNGQLYLDWYKDYTRDLGDGVRPQIKIGKNLLDFSKSPNFDNVFTRLIPVGATGTNGNAIYVNGKTYTDKNGQTQTHATKYISVGLMNDLYTDEQLNVGFHSANDYRTAESDYTPIYRTQSFQNAYTQDELWEYATDFIKNNYYKAFSTYSIKAVDMYVIDGGNTPRILIGDVVDVTYPIYVNGVRTETTQKLVCKALSYDLLNPQNNTYTLGIPSEMLDHEYGTKRKNSGGGGSSGYTPTPDEDIQKNDNITFEMIADLIGNPVYEDPQGLYTGIDKNHAFLENDKMSGTWLLRDPNDPDHPQTIYSGTIVGRLSGSVYVGFIPGTGICAFNANKFSPVNLIVYWYSKFTKPKTYVDPVEPAVVSVIPGLVDKPRKIEFDKSDDQLLIGRIQDSGGLNPDSFKIRLNETLNYHDTEGNPQTTDGGIVAKDIQIRTDDSTVPVESLKTKLLAIDDEFEGITAVVGEFEIYEDPTTHKKTVRIKSGGGLQVYENSTYVGVWTNGTVNGGMLVDKINDSTTSARINGTHIQIGDGSTATVLTTALESIDNIVGEFTYDEDPITHEKTLKIISGGGLKITRNGTEYGVYDDGNLTAGVIATVVNGESSTMIKGDHINISGTNTVQTLAGAMELDGNGNLIIKEGAGLKLEKTVGGSKATFGVYDENNLTAGMIATIVNGESSTYINGDHIYIGNQSATTVINGKLSAADITADLITTNLADAAHVVVRDCEVTGYITVGSGGNGITQSGRGQFSSISFHGGTNSFNTCIVSASVNEQTNTLTLTDDQGNTVNFSKASVTGADFRWNNGCPEVYLSPTGQTFTSEYAIDFGIEDSTKRTKDTEDKTFDTEVTVYDTGITEWGTISLNNVDYSEFYNDGWEDANGAIVYPPTVSSNTSSMSITLPSATAGETTSATYSIQINSDYASVYQGAALKMRIANEPAETAYDDGYDDCEAEFTPVTITPIGTSIERWIVGTDKTIYYAGSTTYTVQGTGATTTPIGTSGTYYKAGTAATYYNAGTATKYDRGTSTTITPIGSSYTRYAAGTAFNYYNAGTVTKYDRGTAETVYPISVSGTYYRAGTATTYYNAGTTTQMYKVGSIVSGSYGTLWADTSTSYTGYWIFTTGVTYYYPIIGDLQTYNLLGSSVTVTPVGSSYTRYQAGESKTYYPGNGGRFTVQGTGATTTPIGTSGTYYVAGTAGTYYPGDGGSFTVQGTSTSVTPIGSSYTRYAAGTAFNYYNAGTVTKYDRGTATTVTPVGSSYTRYKIGTAVTKFKGDGGTHTIQGTSTSVTPIGSSYTRYAAGTAFNYYNAGTTTVTAVGSSVAAKGTYYNKGTASTYYTRSSS